MKVSELTGPELDYWVGRTYNLNGLRLERRAATYIGQQLTMDVRITFSPSTDWAAGGPIIDDKHICTGYSELPPHWGADMQDDLAYRWHGDTLLIAAMRCLVGQHFGEEVPDGV